MKCLILFHSAYGHVYRMAEAVAAGVREVPGAEAVLRKAPETLPDEILKKIGALEPRKAWAHIPDAAIGDLVDCRALIIGTPTRFGGMCAQIRALLDATGGLWAEGAMLGKVGAAFVSTGTQHGGQESTLLSVHTYFLHHGMVVAGLPYAFAGQMVMSEITGGSPYGASTIAGPDSGRTPTENDLAGAHFLGKHVAGLALKLSSPA